MTEEHGILLFDGVCNFCNRAVNFVLARDPGGYFRFASLQSDAGKALLVRHGFPEDYQGSVILIEIQKASLKSDAFCHIMKHLSGGWKLLGCLILIPRPLRDALYDYFARHRYQWFGKRETCRVPAAEEKDRFLS